MGPENSGGPVVAYLDGQPVEIGQTLPEITPDYSAGGVSVEDAAEAMATASKAWADVSITMERYQMNLLRNMEETHQKLEAGENITKGFVEFDAIERGKLRHIRSVHYSERVVQRSTCDNALVPMLGRSLIYDNGACLEGKGVDRSMDRLTAHLQQFYRANGFSNDGWAWVFDFTGYFDNILHRECFNVYSKAFRDHRILRLLKDFVTFSFGKITKRARKPRTKIYYCHPYSAYERGSNENMNRIIRRFFPKGTNFDTITAAEVAQVEEWLANYPRRILDWKTPQILFDEYMTVAA